MDYKVYIDGIGHKLHSLEEVSVLLTECLSKHGHIRMYTSMGNDLKGPTGIDLGSTIREYLDAVYDMREVLNGITYREVISKLSSGDISMCISLSFTTASNKEVEIHLYSSTVDDLNSTTRFEVNRRLEEGCYNLTHMRSMSEGTLREMYSNGWDPIPGDRRSSYMEGIAELELYPIGEWVDLITYIEEWMVRRSTTLMSRYTSLIPGDIRGWDVSYPKDITWGTLWYKTVGTMGGSPITLNVRLSRAFDTGSLVTKIVGEALYKDTRLVEIIEWWSLSDEYESSPITTMMGEVEKRVRAHCEAILEGLERTTSLGGYS